MPDLEALLATVTAARDAIAAILAGDKPRALLLLKEAEAAAADACHPGTREAYALADTVHWPGVHYRRDIGYRAV